MVQTTTSLSGTVAPPLRRQMASQSVQYTPPYLTLSSLSPLLSLLPLLSLSLFASIFSLGDSSRRGDSQMHYSASVKPSSKSQLHDPASVHVAVTGPWCKDSVSPLLLPLPSLAYAVQAHQQASSTPGHPHCHQTGHYQCSVAVHQGGQGSRVSVAASSRSLLLHASPLSPLPSLLPFFSPPSSLDLPSLPSSIPPPFSPAEQPTAGPSGERVYQQ